MSVVQDLKGRPWSIVIDLLSITRVKRETGIHLVNAVLDDKSKDWGELRTNDVVMFDVFVSLLTPQLQLAGVTVEDFGSALRQEQCDQLVQQIIVGVIEYLPPEKRAALMRCHQATMNAARKVELRNVGRVNQAMDSMSPGELERRIMEELEKRLSASTTTSPESSESIPVT